jgi:hypothetical protein
MAGVNKTTTSDGKKLSPFDFLKTINDTKENLIDNDTENTKYYNSFVINRSLSYFPDTIYFANEMNKFHQIDVDLQYNFLLNIIRKRKRFSKWEKTEDINNLNIIKSYFGYNDEKARQVISLLTEEQITTIKKKVSLGGRK